MKLSTFTTLFTLSSVALADFHINTSGCKSHTFCPSASRECGDVDDSLVFSVDLLESNQFNCKHFIDTVGSTTSLERLTTDAKEFETNFCGHNLKFVRQNGVDGFDLFDTGNDLKTMTNVGNCIGTRKDRGDGTFGGDAWQCSGVNLFCHQSRDYICLTSVCQ